MTRIEAIREIHRTVAEDALNTARRAVADGDWPNDPDLLCDLLDGYREWLTSIIDEAVAEAQAFIWWST